MTNAEVLKAIQLICNSIPCAQCPFDEANNGYNNSCGHYMMNHSEEAMEKMEEWWEKNKPQTNAEWYAEQLSKLGFRTDPTYISVYCCPPHLSSPFKIEVTGCSNNCIECREWWREEHIDDSL